MSEEQVAATPAEPEGLNIEDAVADIAESLSLTAPRGEELPEGGEEAAEGAQPSGDKPAEDAAAPSPLPGTEAPAPSAAPTPDAAPDTWTKAAKEKWGQVPPELKAEIYKRENDIAKYVGETKNAVVISKAFEKIVEPYVGMFQQYGIDPWKHTQSLLQTHAALAFGNPEQKVGILRQLAQQAGINLGAVAAGQPAAQDPSHAHIQRLEQRIAELTGQVTGVTSTVQAARAAELEQSVLAFGQDEEAHPFFWEVTDNIQSLLNNRAAATLQEAYEMAVYANPETRRKMLDREAAKRSANLAQLEEARAAKAAKAAAANVRSRKGGRAALPPGSIDDTLKETLASINSRT